VHQTDGALTRRNTAALARFTGCCETHHFLYMITGSVVGAVICSAQITAGDFPGTTYRRPWHYDSSTFGYPPQAGGYVYKSH